MLELDDKISVDVDGNFPLIINFANSITTDAFISWYADNKEFISQQTLKAGAVLIRGMEVYDIESFQKVTAIFAPRFMSYIDGNSPRTKLSSNVYTSTEYDASHHITLHNELSYSNKWPAHLYFCCTIPAQTGGETPIADSRKVVNEMDKALVDEIEKKKIRYIRNLNGGNGFGPSWQDTFETSDKAVVEEICKEREIEWSWNNDNGIKLVHTRPGIISHPETGEKVWFNQIDQFHPSHLDPEIYETLMMMYDDEESMPMAVTFGDGTPVGIEAIEEVKRVTKEVEVPVKWQKGDLLILDNVLSSHGRRPYTGDRKVLVSMS